MAQPFLLEPDPKEKGGGRDPDGFYDDPELFFDIEVWSPPVAHTLSCPTAFPLIRYSSKESTRFVCDDCKWEWVVS